MSSVIIAGDTSGTVTIAAPAVAGTPTLTLPTTSGTILTTTGGVTPGTSGNILTSNGTTWTSAAPAASGSLTLLGTVTTTSGNSVSLGSLVLTSYTGLQVVFQSINNNAPAGVNYYFSSDNNQTSTQYLTYNYSAPTSASGIYNVNLVNGTWTCLFARNSDSGGMIPTAGTSTITTATTTVYLRLSSTYTFTAGSFLVYGVK
jgi:hypothetical protein